LVIIDTFDTGYLQKHPNFCLFFIFPNADNTYKDKKRKNREREKREKKIAKNREREKKESKYSVVVFCDYEIFRPVRDDMLVENDVTNCPRPVGMQCW
jgi:hypothetical protein